MSYSLKTIGGVYLVDVDFYFYFHLFLIFFPNASQFNSTGETSSDSKSSTDNTAPSDSMTGCMAAAQKALLITTHTAKSATITFNFILLIIFFYYFTEQNLI